VKVRPFMYAVLIVAMLGLAGCGNPSPGSALPPAPGDVRPESAEVWRVAPEDAGEYYNQTYWYRALVRNYGGGSYQFRIRVEAKVPGEDLTYYGFSGPSILAASSSQTVEGGINFDGRSWDELTFYADVYSGGLYKESAKLTVEVTQ
jgi:hypothetical protein